jgi:hypothetical protein
MENTDNVIANLGIAKVPSSQAIDGGGHPEATGKPLNYPRNEELIVQCVINSNDEGLALLRALQLIVNSFGAVTITKLVTKLETRPDLVGKAQQYLPLIMNM